MGSEELQERLFQFSVSVIKFLRNWKSGRETDVIRYQLSKPATSVGANYEEAQAAISRKEFAVKISIALKEIRETKYWIKILNAIEDENEEITSLLDESDELAKILGKISSKVNASK